MTTFRWIHLTDLHLGMPGQTPLWPNVEEMFFDDLNFLRKEVGPWDMVLFTGDLTQRGTQSEFEEVDKLLHKFWDRFKKWGFTPKLLAIPGNHDLVRPADQTDPAVVTLLHSWNLQEVQTPFWDKTDSPQRALITTAFQNFTNWWTHTSIPKPAGLQRGILPGDCSATCKVGHDFKIGIVGLNSAYLQLGGGDFENKLHLDVRQLHGACNSNGTEWTKQHDLCLLLTHHPVTWLHSEAQKHFSDEIYPPGRFALHLFGHMHQGNLTSRSQGGGDERRGHQGSSLFSLESWGEEGAKRQHGYSLCELKLEGNEYRLRIWPRRVYEKQGGGRKLDRDQSFVLDKRDGGTKPIIVKRMHPSHGSMTEQPSTELPPSPKTAALYNPANPPFFVPYRQKGDQVIGREDALAGVRQQLIAGRRTAIGQTAVFQGLGGLGKTQLAVEYAYRYRDTYPNGVIWLTADQDLDAQLVKLADDARWIAPASDHKLKLEIALHRLRSYSDYLLIFDNLEQSAAIKNYLPRPPAEPHILVTSRTEQPDFTYVPLEILDPGQSLLLLTQEANRQPESEVEWTAARELARILGGLPLALELAGAYLSRRPVSWQDYLKLLQYSLKQAMPTRLASLTEHEADLYSTLQVSEGIFNEEPGLRDILDILAWSGPAPMGMDLLATLVGASNPTELTGALGLGTALHIIQQVPDTDRYAIHRLVREVRREQEPLTSRLPRATELCRLVGEWFTELREDFVRLPLFEAEIDHLREWHEHALTTAPKLACRLTWLQAYPPFHRGQAQEIKKLVELALDEYSRLGCDDKALLAHMYQDLGYALDSLGDPKQALELTEQALEIQRQLFGELHPDTARSLNNVASYIYSLGDPKKALKSAEQALEIRRQLFGDQHPDTARSLNSVAGYIYSLGDPKRALKLAEQALEIRRQLFGDQHPDTASSLNSVARHINKLGDPKRALKLAEQALEIQRQLFGDQHPDTASSLTNAASYINKLGDPWGALKLAEQALEIRRQLFGDQHPDTASSLNSVATYINNLGDPKGALKLANQALEIQRQLFGEQHPYTALILYNIACFHANIGSMHPAYAYAKKSFEIYNQFFGSQHPSTLASAKLLSQIKRPGFRKQSGKKTGSKKRKKQKSGK